MIKRMINRVLTCLLAVLMLLVGTTTTAFAAEPNDTVPTDGTTSVETRAGYGNVIFPDERSVYISGSVTKVAYTAVCAGKTGAVILKFTNRSTGEVRNHTFTCDNVYHNSSSLGINPFSQGWWDIQLVMTTCDNFIEIYMNFS